MVPLALERLAQKHWTHVLVVALLLVFFWLAFRWFSYFSAVQSAVNVSPPALFDLAASAETIRANHLFGKSRDAAAPVAKAAPQLPPLKVSLKGVFAASGAEPAYAILSLEGGEDEAVKMGDELDDGVVLAEVHPMYVVINRGEEAQEVALEEKMEAAAPRVAAKPPSPGGAPVRNTLAGQKPNPAGLARAAGVKPNPAVNPAPADPAQPAPTPGVVIPPTPAANPGGGLRIDSIPEDSVVEALGLKKGDVITQVNGQPVASLDDLERLYDEFSDVGQVILQGTRDGKQLQLNVN